MYHLDQKFYHPQNLTLPANTCHPPYSACKVKHCGVFVRIVAVGGVCSRTWSFVCSSRSGRRPGALLSPAAGRAQLRKFPANGAVSQSCKAAAPKAAQSHRAKTSHVVPRRQISHTSCCCFAEICSRRQRKRVRSISEGVKVRGLGPFYDLFYI